MKFPLSFPKRKKAKEQCFLVLDIGTESVKTLIFKREGLKNIILSTSLEYLNKFSIFDSRDFETDVIKKAISKVLQNIVPQNLKGKSLKDLSVILGLPANILQGRVVSQVFGRENPKKIIEQKEEKTISQVILKETQKKILENIAQKKGILPQDIQLLSLKILEIKIDGYQVPGLLGYEGKNLQFRILVIFLPKYYLQNIRNIIEAVGLENVNIVHEAQGLLNYVGEKPDGIFLDLGGETTQIFLVKGGMLSKINEFNIGGRAFSQALSERLGLDELSCRTLKERYSKKDLSLESQERIREILWPYCQSWFGTLQEKLKETCSLLPETIFLFGGGSLLPEIREVLKEGKWQDFSFPNKPQVKFLYPKDLKRIEDKTKNLKSPQDVSLLLSCYAEI